MQKELTKKLQRFAELPTFPNVFEQLQSTQKINDFELKGKWREVYFKNPNPIILELGCGRGEYTVGLGQREADKNFIGIDLKGNRIWVGAKQALENKMNNVAFMRMRIDNIETAFAPNEVDEIWITFPDPQPQKPRERKRLTCLRFLEKYKSILKPSGIMHLKTDSQFFYEYSLQVIKENNFQLLDSTSDLYSDSITSREKVKGIKTYYEKLFAKKGFKINYLCFKF